MSSTESRREVQGDVDMASSRPGIRLMKSLVSRVWHTLQAESKMQGGTVRNPRPGWWKHRSGLFSCQSFFRHALSAAARRSVTTPSRHLPSLTKKSLGM